MKTEIEFLKMYKNLCEVNVLLATTSEKAFKLSRETNQDMIEAINDRIEILRLEQ